MQGALDLTCAFHQEAKGRRQANGTANIAFLLKTPDTSQSHPTNLVLLSEQLSASKFDISLNLGEGLSGRY